MSAHPLLALKPLNNLLAEAESPEAGMSTKRIGTLEPRKDASGRTYYCGKVRLADRSRARVDVPERKRYSETASRNHLARAQEEEDTTHAIYNAKMAKAARVDSNVAGPRARRATRGSSGTTAIRRSSDTRMSRPSARGGSSG